MYDKKHLVVEILDKEEKSLVTSTLLLVKLWDL